MFHKQVCHILLKYRNTLYRYIVRAFIYIYIVYCAVKIAQDEQKNDTVHLVYHAGLTIKYIGHQDIRIFFKRV